MLRRVFNALVIAALTLVSVVAAIFIGRDLLSFVSASPRLSPTSMVADLKSEGHIAFTQGGRIVISSGDGGSPKFITPGPIDTTPVWSPDGLQIAFVALNPPDRTGIFVVGADGSGEHPVAPAASLYSRPNWSPDGKRLAFRDSFKARQGIYTVNADGSDLRRIYEGNPNTPVWSPNGQKIAFSFNKSPTTGGVYLLDPDGSNQVLLVEGRFGELAWSPDTKYLAVRSSPKDGVEEMLLVDVASGKPVILASDLASGSWSPSWSPDGTFIACILADGDERKLVAVPSLSGSAPKDLLRAYNIATPVWSPDGSSLLVAAQRRQGEEPVLTRVGADGSGKQQTLALGDLPSWTK